MSTDEQPERIIDDPESYSQQKRVRDLLDRRNDVLEARNRALDEETLGGATSEEALRHYQSRIESLVMDLYTKFGGLAEESGTKYLEDEPIDTVIIPPPEELLPDVGGDMASGAEPPEPQTETIYGLEWFIDNEPIVAKEFSVYSWNPPGKQTAINQRHIPFRTLDKAFMSCMQFMDEMGIDADLSDGDGDAGFGVEWKKHVENDPSEGFNE